MKYTLSTNRGDITLDASSEYDAREQARRAGYSVYSARQAYSHETTDNLGSLSLDMNDGGFGVGIGGGLVIESDGDLGMQVAPGLNIDLGF